MPSLHGRNRAQREKSRSVASRRPRPSLPVSGRVLTLLEPVLDVRAPKPANLADFVGRDFATGHQFVGLGTPPEEKVGHLLLGKLALMPALEHGFFANKRGYTKTTTMIGASWC